MTMTDVNLSELGPVDYLVVEFPAGASNFTGEMAAELLALVDAGTIRVIDVLILTKDEDGNVDATELADVGELGDSGHAAVIEQARDVGLLALDVDAASAAGQQHGLRAEVFKNVGGPGLEIGRASCRERV